ncbi:hypothetical protein QYE76_036060 [Lolium multiflorum]|uniref:RNase H type-1 domain-containing protein n=1 Tax=Lolium multiflorum TaxID=4521 RepID=A0AAD8R227_LOLMU|nr:hypothetical protein QYE76_036060 [Lolium multiflorum]
MTQSLAGAGTQSLVGAVTRSHAGTTRAASARAKAATGAGASTRKAEEIQMAEARSRTTHLAGLPHHHLAVAAEVEAEAEAMVQEAEEDADVEAEPAVSGIPRRSLADPALRKPTRSTDMPCRPIWIRIQARRKHRPRGNGGKGKNKDKEEDSSEAMDEDDNSPDPKAGSAGKSNPFDKKSVGAYHTFLGTPTVRASKSATRILNAIVPAVPQYVRWSEIPCTFDRKDHPAIVPKECYALVANSLGSITLPVAFGDVHNFREEKITFEVVPFKSSYHVIFGRPTYHKFHARACYIYNKLKIPGPKGATYQRTMQRCLKDQIGRNVHAYVDDIAVMTRKGSDLISDLTKPSTTSEVQDDVESAEVRFGVLAGKLLGFIVSHRGIEVNPEKIKAILAYGWGIELSAFDIAYKTRTAVKSQVLADFVADWTEAPDASLEPEPETWVMHFDGSKQHQGSGAGVTLKSPTGEEYVLQIHFEATNNMAEYEALLHGLRIAKEIGIKHIICCGDSDLVAQQVAGTWNARNSVMAAYRDEVDEIAKCFLGYENDEARQLSVDLIEEARNLADQRSAIYQQKLDAITVVEFGIAPSWQETWSSVFDR